MNLEVVKEHFKNAKEVRCLCLGIVFDMNDITERGIHEFGSAYWFDRIQDRGGNSCRLWDKDKGFAEIISYKKDAQRIKEDCELLNELLSQFDGIQRYSFNDILEVVLDFKKDNGLIIEPEKPEYSESVQQAIDALTNKGYLITIEKKGSCE